MSLPVCPQCGSGHVVPSEFSAGHNKCLGCGTTREVFRFHLDQHERPAKIPDAKTVLAEAQRGNQTSFRRGQPKVIYGKTQRPVTHKSFWWERD